MMIVRWHDNKSVLCGSNVYGVVNEDGTLPTIQRWCSSTKERVEVSCPRMMQVYNKTMGGVDKADMLLSLYRNKLKSKKNYRRLFHHGHDLAVNNAWIIATHVPELQMFRFDKLSKFKVDIALSMMRDGACDLPPQVPLEVEELVQDDQVSNSSDPEPEQVISNTRRLDGY